MRKRETCFFLWHNADSVLIPQGDTDTATTTLSRVSLLSIEY